MRLGDTRPASAARPAPGSARSTRPGPFVSHFLSSHGLRGSQGATAFRSTQLRQTLSDELRTFLDGSVAQLRGGFFKKAIESAEQAVSVALSLRQEPSEALLLPLIVGAEAHLALGDTDSALGCVERAHRNFVGCGRLERQPGPKAHFLAASARVRLAAGGPAYALTASRELTRTLKAWLMGCAGPARTRVQRELARGLRVAAEASSLLGDHGRALRSAQKAADLFAAAGADGERALALGHLGTLKLRAFGGDEAATAGAHPASRDLLAAVYALRHAAAHAAPDPRTLDGSPYDIAPLLLNAGNALWNEGERARCFEALREALETAREAFGPRSQPSAIATLHLANAHLLSGEHDVAAEYLALVDGEARTACDGPLLALLEGHARLMDGEGRGALELFTRASEGAAPTEAFLPPLALATAHARATALLSLGRTGEAAELFGALARRLEATLGDRSPHTASAYCGLAAAQRMRGDLREAGALYKRALHVFAECYGFNSRHCADIRYNIAGICFHYGEHDTAVGHLRAALLSHRGYHGEVAEQVARDHALLGRCYSALSDRARALQHLRNAHAAFDALGSARAPEALEVREQMRQLQARRGAAPEFPK